MRNLKKILALVLALMMVLSVMVTASASFNDDADITCTEAVDVMVAAGILNGDGNGNFRPADALERSSAAKLIAYLILGEDIDLVDQTETAFADVELAHWASGYIAYAAELGIVVGDGNGNYNPDGAINGYSFAKMVLLALAELVAPADKVAFIQTLDSTAKVDNEGEWKVAPFTGNYALKVRLAIATLQENDIDLLAGLEDISLNANLTREQAAQMVFNALNDTGILAETYDLNKIPYTNAGLDGYVWVTTDADGKTVAATEPVITDTYVETFASGTTYADVMKALGVTAKSTVAGINYYNTVEGGFPGKPADFVKSTDMVPATYSLDVYKTADGKTLKFMYTMETLAAAKLGKEVTDKEDDNYGLFAWNFNGVTTYAAEDAYTDGAYYLVVVGGGKLVAEPVAAAKVTGKIMSKGSDYVRIDGTKYTFKDEVTVVLGKEYDLYLATDGTVLACAEAGTAPVVTTETLVYVVANYKLWNEGTPEIPAEVNEYGEEIKAAVPEVKAHWDLYVQAIDMNGEVVTYLVAEEAAVNTLVAVTVKDGVASFKAPVESAVVVAPIAYDKDKAIVKFESGEYSYYINSAEYVEITGTLSKVAVGAGSQKNAAASGNAWAFFTGDPTKTTNLTVTKVIYFNGTVVVPEVEASTDMYAFYTTSTDVEYVEIDKDENGKIADSEKLYIYTHAVMINGEIVEIKTEAQVIPVAGPATYKVDEYGYYYDFGVFANQASGEVTNLYGTLASVAGFEDYDIEGITVIDLTEDGNGTVEVGEEVTVITNNKGDTITLIYITKSIVVEE